MHISSGAFFVAKTLAFNHLLLTFQRQEASLLGIARFRKGNKITFIVNFFDLFF
jgi:hypothetical protein